MRVLNSTLIAENIPLCLTDEEVKNPHEVLYEFFTSVFLDETREVLWDVFSRSLITRDEDLGYFPRGELLFYYEELVRLVEASCLLHQAALKTRPKVPIIDSDETL